MTGLIIHAGTAPVDGALRTLAAGGTIVLADRSTPRGQGYLVAGAEVITPDAIGVMLKQARGLICVALPADRCDALDLPPTAGSDAGDGTVHAQTVDAREGVTTGISTADRARTVRLLGSADSVPDDLTRPGHVVPIRVPARDRAGTVTSGPAAALDAVHLAGFAGGAVLCHVLDEDGDTADFETLAAVAARLGLPLVTADDIVDRRMRGAALLERRGSREVRTEAGPFTAIEYRELHPSGARHLALVVGAVDEAEGVDAPLVRVHAQRPLEDLFHGARPGSREALVESLCAVARAGRGVVLYLDLGGVEPVAGGDPPAPPDGPGGVAAAPRAEGYIAAEILRDLGIRAVRVEPAPAPGSVTD